MRLRRSGGFQVLVESSWLSAASAAVVPPVVVGNASEALSAAFSTSLAAAKISPMLSSLLGPSSAASSEIAYFYRDNGVTSFCTLGRSRKSRGTQGRGSSLDSSLCKRTTQPA